MMLRKKPLKKKGLVNYVLILILIAGLGGWGWWQWAKQPASTDKQVVNFTINQGATTAQVAQELENKKLIRSAIIFKYLVRSSKAESSLMPGVYSISPHMTPQEILNTITVPQMPNTVKVTIPEGYTVKQIIQTLTAKGLSTENELMHVMEKDDFAYDFLKNLPSGEHRLEGYLFPDTYFFEPKTTAHELIDVMLKRFSQELTAENVAQLKQSGLSIHQWVTLASMVEREAVKAEERPTIASVMFNRLKINMPLQIDATIQFLLPKSKVLLTYDDLKIESPYNTYLHIGLPPGPIASPGSSSLQAVLHPDKTDYIYYVAKGDGYHAFSKTYQEQLKNQAKYQ